MFHRVSILAAMFTFGCNGDLHAYFDADVVDMRKDIPYTDSDNPRQMLDLYLPRGVEHFPALVFVHGGYWIGQDKNYFAPIFGLYGNVGRALARRGVGVAVINYRLVPDVTFREQLQDVVDAIAWTREHIADYGADASRLTLAGHSAGGHITALLAFDETHLTERGLTNRVSRFVALSPILDLEQLRTHPPEADFNQRVTERVFGDDTRTYSPNTYFKKIKTPLFIAWGEQDEAYLLEQIPENVAKLRELQVPLIAEPLPGHSHSDLVLNFDTNDDKLSDALARLAKE